jgi:hypothetical protein
MVKGLDLQIIPKSVISNRKNRVKVYLVYYFKFFKTLFRRELKTRMTYWFEFTCIVGLEKDELELLYGSIWRSYGFGEILLV